MIIAVKSFLTLVVATLVLQQALVYWSIVFGGNSLYNWPMINVIGVAVLWPFLVLLVAFFVIRFIIKFDPKDI